MTGLALDPNLNVGQLERDVIAKFYLKGRVPAVVVPGVREHDWKCLVFSEAMKIDGARSLLINEKMKTKEGVRALFGGGDQEVRDIARLNVLVGAVYLNMRNGTTTFQELRGNAGDYERDKARAAAGLAKNIELVVGLRRTQVQKAMQRLRVGALVATGASHLMGAVHRRRQRIADEEARRQAEREEQIYQGQLVRLANLRLNIRIQIANIRTQLQFSLFRRFFDAMEYLDKADEAVQREIAAARRAEQERRELRLKIALGLFQLAAKYAPFPISAACGAIAEIGERVNDLIERLDEVSKATASTILVGTDHLHLATAAEQVSRLAGGAANAPAVAAQTATLSARVADAAEGFRQDLVDQARQQLGEARDGARAAVEAAVAQPVAVVDASTKFKDMLKSTERSCALRIDALIADILQRENLAGNLASNVAALDDQIAIVRSNIDKAAGQILDASVASYEIKQTRLYLRTLDELKQKSNVGELSQGWEAEFEKECKIFIYAKSLEQRIKENANRNTMPELYDNEIAFFRNLQVISQEGAAAPTTHQLPIFYDGSFWHTFTFMHTMQMYAQDERANPIRTLFQRGDFSVCRERLAHAYYYAWTYTEQIRNFDRGERSMWDPFESTREQSARQALFQGMDSLPDNRLF